MSDHFYLYAITFDEEVFGVFSTREKAEKNFEEQIAGSGPAWEDCKIVRWKIEGIPEMERGNMTGLKTAILHLDANKQETYRPKAVIDKINELIDQVNELTARYEALKEKQNAAGTE